MRTTVTLDDTLLAEAVELTGISQRSKLLEHALRTLVELEAGRRLAKLGGSAPGLIAPRRRRTEPA